MKSRTEGKIFQTSMGSEETALFGKEILHDLHTTTDFHNPYNLKEK